MPAESVAEEIAATQAAQGQLHFILVEDDPLDVELIQRELHRAGFEFTAVSAQTRANFIEQLKSHCPDVILADYSLPEWTGMEALDVLAQEGLDVPLIMVSGRLGEETAVECIKLGATDYVLKRALARLPVAIRRAVQEHNLRERRKQAEEALARKVEELARSNRELEQFAYVASHDLQEPLRMVASYTELLAERYRGQLDANADKYIAYAVDGAKRMQRLIRDLLAYARVSSQAKPLEDTDVAVVLSGVLAQLRTTIEKNNAIIICGEMPTVKADQMQLGQVFQNLIANAIKFHGETPPQVEIRAKLTGEIWDFTVADNGIGIEKEHSGRIFQMFQRLHTREEYEGNGIGLTIAKRIIERHRGSIWFDSEPGKGTTFHFTIPKDGGNRREEGNSNSPGGRQSGGRGFDAGDATHQPAGN
jgi:signal transduction histidine kinase